MLDAINRELTICKLLLWVQMVHHMHMEHIFLIYISKIHIQTILQKLTLLQQGLALLDSIQIYMLVEKFALVC